MDEKKVAERLVKSARELIAVDAGDIIRHGGPSVSKFVKRVADFERSFIQAQKDLKGLHAVGAGDTEAITLLQPLKEQIRALHDETADILLTLERAI